MSKKSKDVPLIEQFKPIFKERFSELLGSEEEYLKFTQCLIIPQRKSFRINTLKEDEPDKLVKNLKDKGILLTPVPWSKHSYFTEYSEDSRTDLGNLYEHFLGKIYVQEATSMCPPELLDIPEEVPKDFKILDMAAAPGSKTTQIGILMQNKGVLIANEVDYSRLGALKGNLERTGLTNVVITNNDGARISGEEIFDRVLLDAPCSGSGVIRKSPKTIKTYNPRRLKGIQRLQLRLLQRSFELLKKGGILTYSTCSLDPEENEICIQKFLEANPSAELLEAKLPGLILENKVTEFKGVKIDPKITQNTIRIWPHHNDTNGFYVAKIKKL